MINKKNELLNIAYEKYNLDQRESIDKEVLKYIRTRLVENKEMLEKFIKIQDECSYEEILKVFDKEFDKKGLYKKEKLLKKVENDFVYGIYTTSIGNIAVECSNTLDALKYFILAITSRNTITISDINYDKFDLKHLLLIIFSEALGKFEIDKNILQILPYEECYYERFDTVIYHEDKKIQRKKWTNKLYIYKEDNYFDDEINKEIERLSLVGNDVEILVGNFYDNISIINETNSLGACIYTKNPQLGYKFINLVHSRNVFVNTSFIEIDDNVKKVDSYFYMVKKIMYPLRNN